MSLRVNLSINVLSCYLSKKSCPIQYDRNFHRMGRKLSSFSLNQYMLYFKFLFNNKKSIPIDLFLPKTNVTTLHFYFIVSYICNFHFSNIQNSLCSAKANACHFCLPSTCIPFFWHQHTHFLWGNYLRPQLSSKNLQLTTSHHQRQGIYY